MGNLLRSAHLLLLCAVTASCVNGGGAGGGGVAGGSGAVSPLGTMRGGCPPSSDGIFLDRTTGTFVDPQKLNFSGGDLEFPSTDGLISLCCLPDADSFDSYEEDGSGSQVPFGTGTPIPLSEDCAADGRETGPRIYEMTGDLNDLYPSKWCPDPSCP